MLLIPVRFFEATSLVYPPQSVSTEVLVQFRKAVELSAQEEDPMAKLLGSNNGSATLQLMSALDWLVANAPLDVEAIIKRDGEENYFTHGLNGDQREGWLFNIHTLAFQLLEANYMRGHELYNTDPVFRLQYEYITDDHDNLYSYSPEPLEPMHWTLFVQAVIAQDWLDFANEAKQKGLPYDQLIYARAEAYLEGALILLAGRYSVLGECNEEGYFPLPQSTGPAVAIKLWRHNIEQAAAALRTSLR